MIVHLLSRILKYPSFCRMSSFLPKQWAVRYLRDMDQLECTAGNNNGIAMEAFLAVKRAEDRRAASASLWAAQRRSSLNSTLKPYCLAAYSPACQRKRRWWWRTTSADEELGVY